MRILYLFLLFIGCYNQPNTINFSKSNDLICLFDSLNVSSWDNINIEEFNNPNKEKNQKKTELLNSLIDRIDSIPNSQIKFKHLIIYYHRIDDKGILISRNSQIGNVDTLLIYKKKYIDQHIEGKIFKINQDTIYVKDFYIYDTECSITSLDKWFIDMDGRFIKK